MQDYHAICLFLRRNFNILTRLLMGVGAECLRKYFLTIHPTWSNKPSDASALKKGVLKLQTEEETIFNTGNIEKWDVSLLFRILRFSAVSSVELTLNPDKKVALCSIREIRNKIFAHAANEKVNDGDFKMLWEALKFNLLMIGGSEEDINETLIGKTKSEYLNVLHMKMRVKQQACKPGTLLLARLIQGLASLRSRRQLMRAGEERASLNKRLPKCLYD